MPPIDNAKLDETMDKYYPDLVCKYYPDQPSYTPTPSSKPSTPPTIEEYLAKLADNIDKLELVVKRLAASTTNLVSITSQTSFTKNESNDHTINTKTVVTETIIEVVTKTSSIINSMSKPDKTMAQVFTVHSSSITKMKNDVATQPQTSLYPVLDPPTN
ncbi:hypothetical protein Tco_1240493, partial [Tanacetum coccineum]